MDVSATAFDLVGSTSHGAKIPFPHVSIPIPPVGNVGIVPASTSIPTFLQALPVLLDESFSGFINQNIFVTFACVIDFLTISGSPVSGSTGVPITGMSTVEFRDYQGNVDPLFTGQITLEIDQDSTLGVAVLTFGVAQSGRRGIGSNPVASAAKQFPNRLAGGLAGEIPQR